MSVDNKFSRFPKKHRTLLRAAAIYNLIWGALCILFPIQLLMFFHMEPLPNYPELWQCLGMITAVYGIGYWIASWDPVRHWPIVLVGLLGKILDPIGYVYSLVNERVSEVLGLAILTNDLVWWIPFTMILWNARQKHRSEDQDVSLDEPLGLDHRFVTRRRRESGARVVWSSVNGSLREHP